MNYTCTTIESFEKKVIKTNDCWEWQGCLQVNGYGKVGYKNKTMSTHRLAYLFYKGALIEGKVIMHSCDNRKCVNPDHLTQGTQQDNVDDYQKKGRHRVPKGENSPKAKLNRQQVLSIRNQKGKKPERTLAKEFGVSQMTINKILRNQTWKNATYQT